MYHIMTHMSGLAAERSRVTLGVGKASARRWVPFYQVSKSMEHVCQRKWVERTLVSPTICFNTLQDQAQLASQSKNNTCWQRKAGPNSLPGARKGMWESSDEAHNQASHLHSSSPLSSPSSMSLPSLMARSISAPQCSCPTQSFLYVPTLLCSHLPKNKVWPGLQSP